MNRNLITIGFDSDGDADFGVRGDITDLTFEEMKELRSIIPVAIGIAEDMWRRAQERRNPSKQGEK